MSIIINERKLKRFHHSLKQHANLNLQDEPTSNVVLCNAGVSTGLRENDLIRAFNLFGNIKNIFLIPEKSFSVVVFDDLKSAIQACKNLNGTTALTQHGHPLYLTYSSNLPSVPDEINADVPAGLKLIENFITLEEEKILLSLIDFNSSEAESDLKNRRVKHFGYEFLYSCNNIDLNNPMTEGIPVQCNFLWNRLKDHGVSIDCPPNQLTVNQYNPGQGIPSHVDTHSAFLSPLISLSLNDTVIMEFKRIIEENSYEYYKLPLPPRSMLILEDSARYEWMHGITPRNYDVINGKVQERHQRTSYTFRWVRRDKKCDCKYYKQCDTFKESQSCKMNKDFENIASLIEKQHVHKVYENIATHFDDTRTKIWPCVEEFVKKLPMGSLLVDIGCGNGKNFHIRGDIMQIGIEYNSTLAEIAAWRSELGNVDINKSNKENLIQIVRGDCLYIPFRSNFADAAMSIAVFHHLVTEERRKKAILETIRILKPGGLALVTVWARDQSKHNVKTSYLKQNRKNRKSDANITNENHSVVSEVLKDENGQCLGVTLPVHVNRTQFFQQDMLVPWKLKSSISLQDDENNCFMRFYHVFEDDELKNLCETLNEVTIENYFYEQGNWCIILKKK